MTTDARTVRQRGQELYERRRRAHYERTDRLLAGLLVGEWIFGIVLALLLSPYAWAGRERSLHEHVYASSLLGAIIVSLPLVLAWKRPGRPLTRHAIAVAQMLYSALLIHLTGGRIETHFHIFGSLAFLAFYRDYKVLLPATLVVACDHLVRQLFWPESVYGIANPETWRFLEHASWVVFEDVFLVLSCLTATREMRATALQHAEVEALSDREREKSIALDKALEDAIFAKQEAEKASRIKGQFLANMSHEIRTPLAGVIGLADLLSRTELSARQLQYVRTLKSSGKGLLAVINDVLDLSKIEAGKMELSTTDFRLRQVVDTVAKLLSATAEAKGLTLRNEVDDAVPVTVSGDADRLRQVLTNLVSNAVKFTERGQIDIRTRLVHRTERDVLLRIDVTDTGIGIAAEHFDLLFQPFSQVDNSNARKFGGTGLGLAISKQIVELMGGEIGVLSKLGEGTTVWFTFRMEVRADMPLLSSWPAKKPALPVGEARVLVADDNPVTQLVARELLEALGYQVDTVDNGKLALRALADNDYAAVLMDCQMPEMTGYEAATELRRREGAKKRTPIIAVTANVMEGDRERVISSGMDDYLTKPLDLTLLSEVMVRWTKSSAPGPKAPAMIVVATPDIRCSPRVGKMFLEDLPGRLVRLREAFAAGEIELRKEGHSLKGSALSIGASALAEACLQVETGPVDALAENLTRVEAEADALMTLMLNDPRFAQVAIAN